MPTVRRRKDTSYHGNKNLKQVGFEHEYTPDQIREYMRCQKDPIYFIETYVTIISLDHGAIPFKLYECQKAKVLAMIHESRLIVMEPRQQGKTVTAAAAILWYTLFNEDKTVAILAHKGSGARQVMSIYQLMYENLPIWLQQGVKTWNKGDIDLENGTKIFTAATTASGIRGKSVNWLYIDEAAIIPNNVAEEFFASTYPTISSGKTTKILLTSTPLGYNHFWKFWNEAGDNEPGKNSFKRLFIPYTAIPGRDIEWANARLAELGEVKFNQEVLCQFLGSSHTLISGIALSQMSSTPPLETTLTGLAVYEKPLKGHTYAMCCDTAEGIDGDASAFVVVDTSAMPYNLVAKFKSHKIAPLLYPKVIHEVAKAYNEAWVLIETIDIGRQVADVLHDDLEYENILYTNSENSKTVVSAGFGTTSKIGLHQNKSTKRVGCFTLKTLIEDGQLRITDADCIKEMSTFVEKGNTYKADVGYHDDLMMSLVMFGWLTSNTYFKDLTSIDIRKQMYENREKEIEDDVLPMVIIEDGTVDPERITIDRNGDLWFAVDNDPSPETDLAFYQNFYSFSKS